MTTCCLLSTLSTLFIFSLAFGIADPFKHRPPVFNRVNPNLLIYNPQSNPFNKVNSTAPQIPLEDSINSSTSNEWNKSGHGIVYTGNRDLFGLIHVSISILDYLQSTEYPIEIFVNAVPSQQNEDLLRCKSLFTDHFASTLDIRCILIDESMSSRYSYKILALLHTRFQHVIFLDADNVMIQSPSLLFESTEYLQNGAIFWPDLWGKECAGQFDGGLVLYASCIQDSNTWNGISKVMEWNEEIQYDVNDMKWTQSQESAQLVVNTVQHHETLLAVLECTESGEYQQYLHGDKDCFRLMFLQKNTPFFYVPIQPEFTGFVVETESNLDFRRHALFQFWESAERVMFIHQTKWIEPMDHALWEYTLKMTMEWQCPVHNGQDHIFPFPQEDRYTIRKTISREEDGDLIHNLETKWIEFWFQFQETM